MKVEKNYNLKDLNTFGVDVDSKWYFSFSNEQELLNFSNQKNEFDSPILILGGGSNILFVEDYKGIIIHPKNKQITVKEESENEIFLEVGAGLNWDEFVEYCVKNSYYGIENLSLIPGNVGAVPVQNIGAYGVEAKDVIERVKVFDFENSEFKELSNSECKFSYRNSIFKSPNYKNVIVTSVVFKLYKKSKLEREGKNRIIAAIKGVFIFLKSFKINIKRKSIQIDYRVLRTLMEESGLLSLNSIRKVIINKRRSKLPDPDEIGNVGSFFKNPIVSLDISNKLKGEYPDIITYPHEQESIKISAGWLIEKCGWLNKQEENVSLYKDQALVIINKGNASGREIFQYSQKILESVLDKFGIVLEREVVVIKKI